MDSNGVSKRIAKTLDRILAKELRFEKGSISVTPYLLGKNTI
jgi:hypothetical protein